MLTGTLEQSLSRTLPGGKVGVVVSIDRSQFAAAYEGSVLSMDKLTSHQLEKMKECLNADYVHLQAPAGAGKTFVALNRVLELLYEEKEARALFVARNAALCYFVIRWVCRRVRNTLQRLLMLQRLDVLFEPFSMGPQAVQLERGRIQMVPRAARSHFDGQYSLLVVDEAHHIYKDHGLRDAVEKHVPEGCRRMLLSDISQSSGRDIAYPAGESRVVQLTEVVRSSQRIVAGAAAFQLGENKAKVTSQHNATGPPLKSFLFDADGSPGSAEYFGSYVEHTLRALHHVMTTFGTLELHDRVAIVVPDSGFAESFGPLLERALSERWPKRPFQLVSAQEASASALPGGAGRGAEGEWLVLDEIAAFDGLERLIVLAIGLDAVIDQSLSSSRLETRSRLYRALTRAHMLAIVVNEFLRGGWLEFLGQVSLKDGSAAFNRKEEMERRVNGNAVDKLTGDAIEQAMRDETQAVQKMRRNLLAWRIPKKYRADLSRLAKQKYRRSLPPWMTLGADFESIYGRPAQTEAELVSFAKALIEELVSSAKVEAKAKAEAEARAKAEARLATLETSDKVAATKAEAALETEAEVQAKVGAEKEVKEEAKIAQTVWDTSDNKTQQLMGPAIFNPYARSALAALAARPARGGIKVFVVLRTRLASVKYTGEPIEMYDEFWVHHPHGKQPLLFEFVAIVLTDEQVDEQLKDIRIASYRWKDIKGIGVVDEEGQQQYQTPGNFGWFLVLCKEHGWIGWIDFFSNIVVNVPAEYTVSYMGKLFAECTVVLQGLYEQAALVDAMGQAWIFQETAFGPLVEHGVRRLLESVRALGERVRAGEERVLLGEFAEAADGMARLLNRRGWEGFLAAEKAELTTGDDYVPSDTKGGNAEVMADILVQRLGGMEEERLTRQQLFEESAYPRNWVLYRQVVNMVKKVGKWSGWAASSHVLDYFTRPAAANLAEPLVPKLLTTSRHKACATVDTFLDTFGLSMLKAYGTLRVSFEKDRAVAVTEVARSMLATRYKVEVDAVELLRMAWVRATTFFKERSPGFAINGIQKSIPEGKRLLGLGTIKGTPILAASDSPSCYKTASGEVHDLNIHLGRGFGLSFSDGVFAHAGGQQYHGFLCQPPPMLADKGAHLIQVYRRVEDPASQPAIVYVMLGSQYSCPPAAQEVAFD